MTREIGEIFECKTGDIVVCEEALLYYPCIGCIYEGTNEPHCQSTDKSIGECFHLRRSDDKSVIFRKIETDEIITDNIVILKKIAKEYPGKTIEDIIKQIEARN